MECLQELYAALGEEFLDVLGGFAIRPAQLRELHVRFGAAAGTGAVAAASGAPRAR